MYSMSGDVVELPVGGVIRKRSASQVTKVPAGRGAAGALDVCLLQSLARRAVLSAAVRPDPKTAPPLRPPPRAPPRTGSRR